jgi:hypothetical protein
MAGSITIELKANAKQFNEAVDGAKRKLEDAADAGTKGFGATRSAISGVTSALTALAAVAAFKQIAQFGIDLDKSRNAMTALTGSVAKANEKLAELRELAKASPGVTNTFATQLFSQLKSVGTIADATINKVIQSLGKLNTVFGDVGPDFARNLIQIFQQGFERSDIKEALGRVPIFEQLLKEAFGTSNPEKLRKLKEAGVITGNTFLSGISDAINKRFKDVEESLGGRFQKLFNDLKVRLAEIGEQLLKFILPVLDKLLPILKTILDLLNSLPDGLKAAVVGLVAVAPAINAVTGAIGGLRIAASSLGGFLFSPAGIAVLALLGIGTAAIGLKNAIEGNETNLRQQFDRTPRDLQGKPLFEQFGPGGTEVVGDFSLLDAAGRKRDPLKFTRDLNVIADRLANPLGGATKPPPGGGGAGNAAASEAARKRAEEIKDLREKLREAMINDFADSTLKDLEEISSTVTGLNLQGVRDEAAAAAQRADRPRQLAAFNAANAERLRQIDLESAKLEQNTAKQALENLKKIEPVLSNSERFMKGFAEATIQVGDAFDNFGRSVANAFSNVRTLFDSLKRAVFDFFNDLLGSFLQNLVGRTLLGLGGRGGSSLAAAVAGAFGGGISAPPSTTATQQFQSQLEDFFGAGVPRTAGSIASGGSSLLPGFSLSGLGGSLAAAAPLLGLGLGPPLGGQSTAGKILGAIGGGAVGLGVSFGASIFGAGGGLTQAALAALGPAALIGAPLIVGAILLGKASQRKKDEQAAGEFQRQAHDALAQLKAQIDSDQIDGGQARAIFENQILAQFVQQIGGLQTKSVRESRLTNQVRDIRGIYDAIIPPSIEAQQRRRQHLEDRRLLDSRLVPEFATGGLMPWDGWAKLHRGELIVNPSQQTPELISAAANAGVPGTQAAGSSQPQNISVVIELGTETQDRLFINGARSRNTKKDLKDALNNILRYA